MTEGHVRNQFWQRAQIDHLDRPKRGDVGNKPVDPRANVEVPAWLMRKHVAGCPEILMEVVPHSGSSYFAGVTQFRIHDPGRCLTGIGCCLAKRPPAFDKAPEPGQASP